MEVYLTSQDLEEAEYRLESYLFSTDEQSEQFFYDAHFPEPNLPSLAPPPSCWLDFCAHMAREEQELEKRFQLFKKTHPREITILSAQAELHGVQNVDDVVDIAMERIFYQTLHTH